MEWHELTELTQGRAVEVERVRLLDKNICIEGPFELPPLAKLKSEDQYFVSAFIRAHGSIKEMEKLFGISYPTVKNRLNRIAEQVDLVEVYPGPPEEDVLSRLESGELSAEEAENLLRSQNREA